MVTFLWLVLRCPWPTLLLQSAYGWRVLVASCFHSKLEYLSVCKWIIQRLGRQSHLGGLYVVNTYATMAPGCSFSVTSVVHRIPDQFHEYTNSSNIALRIQASFDQGFIDLNRVTHTEWNFHASHMSLSVPSPCYPSGSNLISCGLFHPENCSFQGSLPLSRSCPLFLRILIQPFVSLYPFQFYSQFPTTPFSWGFLFCQFT